MLLLEKASHYFSKKLPFALFVKPNQIQLNGVFQNTNELVPFSGQKGFVFSGFYNTKDVVLPFDSCEIIQENWIYEKQNQERITVTDVETVLSLIFIASRADVTVINLSTGGLELQIQNLESRVMSFVSVRQWECKRLHGDRYKFGSDGKCGFLPVVLSSGLTNQRRERSQILE